MGFSGVAPLVQNAVLLLILSVIMEVTYIFPLRFHRLRPVIIGALIALICVTVMAMPYIAQPGVRFDSRSILISVTGLIFGLIPTIITSVAAIAYRISMGGIGTVSGVGIIILSAAIGLIWRRWLYPRAIPKYRWLNVLLMNIAVHLAYLLCVMMIPYPSNIEVMRIIALPVLIFYPVTASLLCLLLLRQQETRQLQEQLKQSEERFRVLFDEAPLGYQSLDSNGKMVAVNQQWLDMFGYCREEVIGKWFGDFVCGGSMAEYRSKFASFITEGYIQCELVMLTKEGKQRYINFEGKAKQQSPGEALQAKCILKDITDQKETQERLRISEEKYGSLIRNASEGIAVINEKGRIVETNQTAATLSGYTKDELLGMYFFNVLDSNNIEPAQQMLNTLAALGTVAGEIQYRHKTGDRRWAGINAVRLSGNHFLCFVTDITKRKRALEKLVYSNTHDDLTGLWNRQYFDVAAERLNTSDHMPLSIIIGDINGLKLINDSFGRKEGDRVIAETAAFIGRFCRTKDILARTGGDEFSILLPETDFQTTMHILHSIQAGCAEYNAMIADDALHINIALGAAAQETTKEEFPEVTKRAEHSMNQRKLLQTKSSQSSIIATIKATMREKSHETEEHEERIAKLARKVGVILGLSQIDLDHIELIASLHDIGKVGISERILNKPGSLNPDEWREMKKHPEIGERIAMATANLAPIANYILCHHERWDGNGYPQNLSGYDIPLLSRIIAIVDAYDAMTQDRVYQKAVTRKEALAEIMRNAGTQFDPQLARIFCEEVFQLQPEYISE